jgi:signal transduction histidine kinase
MRDGRIKYVREQGETFYAPDGQPLESRGTVHDITEEILLQRSLTEKNIALTEISSQFELAIQAANMGIWIFNFADNTFIADKKILELYEMCPALLDVPLDFEEWTSRCHPDDVQEAVQLLREAASELKNLEMDFRIVVPSGIKHLHSAAIIKYDKDGIPIGIIGTNQDVTAYKVLDESRIFAQKAAEDASKMKSDFLANMLHEIRTPLNGVIGLTEMLLQTQLQPLQREYLNKSETASRALLNVLNNILDYSKIEAHKLILETTPFNLDDIMNSLIAMLSYKAEQKNLSLEIHIDNAVPRTLIGDPLRLQQILSNLVVNALKFTDAGYVRISVTSALQDDHDKLTFSVSDSGIGMSEDDQTALFLPFSHVDTSFTRKYGGSGLGLMITKELVDLMGGEITVHSVRSEGSTFAFSALFGRATVNESNENEATSIHPLPDHKPLHLLLVEDNDLNQLVASERLKQMGITCSIANNVLEAIGMVQRETFDAILMDLQMPVMDGLEATREIRKLEGFAHIHIIALSAAVQQDDLSLALEAGMNDFVAKPIDKILLQNVLSKWLSV